MRYGFMTDAAQAAEQVAKRFRGIVPDHTKLVRAIATALIARERQVWGKAIAQVALIGTQRDPNGDKHTVVTTIQEFRRRTQALGKISS